MGRFISLGAPRWTILALTVFLAPQVVIAQTAPLPTSTTAAGDIVRNPSTNTDVEVLAVSTDANGEVYSVLTNDGATILAKTTVGDIIFTTTTDGQRVTAVTNNASGLPISIDLEDTTDTTITSTENVVSSSGTVIPQVLPTPGTPESTPSTTPPGAVINEVKKGASGGDGQDAFGFEICDPLFGLGCATVGQDSEPGEDGSKPSDFNRTIEATHGLITSNTAGITIGNIGGDGGDGGDAAIAINLDGSPGGQGGEGGNVTVTNRTDVDVTGKNSFGLTVFSLSGDGGNGGSCLVAIACQAGGGGGSKDGGTVTVTNDTTAFLETDGQGAHGIYALSSGGSGGGGGTGWGIVGEGGSGASGGNGGNVFVNHHGDIYTQGDFSHGILAQSIGGTGGNGGTFGGIVSLGGDGGQGGVGRNVRVETSVGSSIRTEGLYSAGIVAQSIGGSGGDSGSAGGIVTLGSNGGSGNNAGTATVINRGSIQTSGNTSYGILAQSIGGGGGSTGGSGGVVTLGGTGGIGGTGNTVTVTNESTAVINTTGQDAKGIFAQSIGGGGGSAGATGGIVSLGGDAANGATGGSVTVTNNGTVVTGRDLTTNTDTFAKGTDAIFAQSIGGGGGAGASSGGLVALGGSGGGGGNGGAVTVTNNGTLRTTGDLARGVFAQSVGGGGGAGGTSGGLVAISGSGGTATTGGNVSVNTGVSSLIVTAGQHSTGIYAQSIGGGGGTGGSSGGLVAIGGSSGGGGNAGTVTLNTGGTIVTQGADAVAIFAQSVGGGGGNSLASGGLVTIGGSGNSGGGTGNTVTVTSSTLINTAGDNSHGIFAQSVGGGGGSAGPAGGLVSIGGNGGNGGDGGVVTVTNTGGITTQGKDAKGIFAQSVGGGGGYGGVSGGLVSLGGDGSGGGDAQAVTVNNTNAATTISTQQDGSDAIFAQSIGGGGGAGAASGGLVSLGGDSSSGGLGRAVIVNNDANLSTQGAYSRGIFAQSVGGGGGAGGASGGLVSIGGNSDSGSNAGDVTVTNTGDIVTGDADSTAIFAQSVGGGGGAGGSSGGVIAIGGGGTGGGDSGVVTVNTTGDLSTTGDRSSGVFAQSVGGGGGDGATAGGLITIGGSAGSGSDAEAVNVTHGGTISTTGDDALGIFAQSVGGGGGNGGSAYSGSLFIGFSLGGSGSSGGEGGVVNVDVDTFTSGATTSPALITTEGDRSTGILAQSVGGGGGNGGTSVQATVGTGASISVAIGGNAGEGGTGGVVNLTGTGDVSTKGNNAAGVILQSVGGGGGNGGTTVSAGASIGDGIGIAVGIGGNAGEGGDGGLVTADVTSNITTEGEFSAGFIAQSIGGGGGNGGTTIAASAAIGAAGAAGVSVGVGGDGGNGGDGKKVDVTFDGSVRTEDNQSDGIVIQSIGGGGGNGGLTVAASATAAGAGAGNVTVGIGSGGGKGGLGGEVEAVITSNVTTLGDGSDGVIIQSIGGGGGNSGLTISAGFSGAGVGAGGVNVGIGASGGDGGNSDVVNAEYNGDLITTGDNATGLLVQSVGGGGGNSSGTIAASLNGAGAGAGSVAVGIGGSGGIASDGGKDGVDLAVTLNTTGTVTTNGNYSSGIVAQSIGGGGGNGGYSIAGSLSGAGIGSGAISVGVGGGAGGGGKGKGVIATLASNVQTLGTDSTGILVQSIGGGGGNGGFNVSGSASGAGIGSGGIAVGLGGTGGDGGLSGNVQASSSGTVTTVGDRSAAFVIQSIGGGGGNGGFNVSGSLSGAGVGSGAVTIGLGGSGGAGQNAGTVTASSSDKIRTSGDQSAGILAQSLGGGGGNGGFNVTAGASGAGTGSGAIGVGLGGSGAGGGKGNTVNVNVSETVDTFGDDSGGITAQSIGGGGGNGGFNVTATASGAGIGSGAIGVGLGSSGAGGGDGGAVIVLTTAAADIQTRGDRSHGFLAQSIGGGGGNGGFNISATGSGAGTGSGAIDVGLGGSGGGAGNGGVVDATSGGTIVTGTTDTNGLVLSGDDSAGFIAQSIGGGGGNGGFNVNVAGSGAGVGSGAVAVGLGASAGDGGTGGNVTAKTLDDILTVGDRSGGFLAQSIGGGGGNGGFNVTVTGSGAGTGSGGIGVGLGGSGGAGGKAGVVDARAEGLITTIGDDSTAFAAQSIGGGGGNGGFNVTVTGSGAGVGSGALSVGLGGKGNGGAEADAVTAITLADIYTAGDRSYGFLAQSVGGGGGSGGFNVSVTGSGAGTGSGGVGVGLGGSGGGGGNASNVTATSEGRITTLGDDSTAFAAQSLGGGGGNGGFNVDIVGSGAGTGSGTLSVGLGGSGAVGANAGNVTAKALENIYTEGDRSYGFLAQSLGGGGGNGGFNVNISGSGAGTGSGAVGVGLGGTAGGGGNAGSVTATTEGFIVTLGNDSTAFAAQSLGGGGGNGGFNVTVAGSGAGQGSGAATFGLGGSGGGGGNAGSVAAIAKQRISTAGDRSLGLFAQSIGGGGGNGGFNVSVTGSGAGTGSGAVNVGLGGSGGGGGNASSVTATALSTIMTEGDDANAFTAQSIGGGGGNGSFNVSIAGSGAGTGSGAASVGLGGSGGGGGNGAAVTAETADYIQTLGDRSAGIVAQSVGGGGGNGGFNVTVGVSGAKTGSGALSVGLGGSGGDGGDANTVDLTVNNDVVTKGMGSTGIVAQSVGGGGGNGGVNVAASLSYGGTGSGAVGVGIGGFGGGGGNASNVTSTINGNINALAVPNALSTETAGSGGVLLQSLGGGGGNGGTNVTGSLSLSNTGGSGAVSVGIGGAGGGGGNAGNVTNTLEGDVNTVSNEGMGVAAQSIGGGGGNGGINVSGTLAASKAGGSGALGVGIGGFGGDGGDAGTVTNNVKGNIQTLGNNSDGVLAQSIGGGGGNGATNVTATVTATLSQTGSGNLGVGVGGFGGGGGKADAVINNVTGRVTTSGNASNAIMAQSLGGGGGNGGTNITANVNFTKGNGGTLGMGIGGFGGDGGDAGTVDSTVVVTGGQQISTIGKDSSGVVAQSLAGGGGNGGVNITGVANITGQNGAAIGVGIGGFGGGGGNADDVTVDVTGEIQTKDSGSHGIFAQSVGGGGGSGGTNVTGTLAFTSSTGTGTTAAVSVGVGGFGGDGGNAGDVDVTYSGTEINAASSVDSEDSGAHGLAAQSIGGGGGDGAVNVSAGLSFASSSTTGDAYGVMFGVGGFGGAGGTAGAVNVTVNNTNSITANGQDRAAILAQSLGGGGGNGGLNVTGGITTDSSLLVGIGGFGANAGTASKVSVTANTNLFANASDNDESPSAAAGGIVAQSIGGGGGNGALNVTGGITLKKESSLPSINVGIGGFGGAGAESDTVTVNHTGNITSVGDWTHGVLAQSIAGGGGNGGTNVSGQLNFADSTTSGGKTDLTIVAGIGGKGGDAADSEAVTVTQNGVISTSGDYARGIIAQSIGGGGGTGGMNITGVIAQKSSPIQVGIGGSGGDAGNAGSVLVNRGTATAPTGQITTDGEGAYGIEASSIGGGGGDAGINFNVGFTLIGKVPSQSGSAVQVTIGGNGGASSNSSTAEVNNYSDIFTQGRNSHGILAQSLGGGGGNANLNHAFTYANPSSGAKENKNLGLSFALGGAVGDGGYSDQVDVVHVGDITTLGDYSFGIMAQSVGGGGGNADSETESKYLDFATAADGVEVGGPSVSIAIGRNGGDGGYSGKVNLASEGQILTEGKGSYGLLAQSIGGGGGNSTSTSVSASFGDAEASISVGLKGGTGGHSDNVTLDAQGRVITLGENAHGVFAQSIGGGGGNGGSDDDFTDVGVGDLKTAYDSVTDEGTGTSVNVSIGGEGGKGGYSGNVKVTSSADVSTNADRSVGILAQSVGGGGGTGGLARTDYSSAGSTIDLLIGGKGGVGMYSGNVNVSNSGFIRTNGDTSHGILAQSLGGGGGNGGMAIKATLLNTSSGTFSLSTSLGGNGGEGGKGGDVMVTNESSGTIFTQKDNSFGIFAQSVGGGGGNGGTAIAGTLISAQDNRFALTIGGTGGTGGTGGEVEVINNGTILTLGEKSHGIVAQSVGGGGGTGGLSLIADLALIAAPSGAGLAGNFAIGGSGGSGNTSGDVTVKNTGSIEVRGDGAYGIYAQSVGGGGGDGGFAASFSTSALAPDPATMLAKSLLTFAMGGFGGAGADSGDVLVEHSGNITSYGDNAFGIYAQSVGGGGGKSAYSISSPVWTVADAILKTVVGGGSAGEAGKTTINTTGNIAMFGENSQASFAQSVNGGGGNTELFLDLSFQDSRIPVNAVVEAETQLGSEGADAAISDEVVMTHVGNLATTANNSIGSLMQAIGGGGGQVIQKVIVGLETGSDFVSSLGAINTNNSHGGDISKELIGNITTLGGNSMASAVQSIGGGGGSLRLDVQTVDGEGNDVSDTASKATGSIVLGADPSYNNNAGAITMVGTGDTTTVGDRSTGELIQSIGAGGGLAQMSGMNGLTIEIGASDGSTGNGGDITFTKTGNVSTAGELSHGVVLQSIGGGGGFVLTDLDPSQITINKSAANSGSGGNIIYNQIGDVTVSGDRSFGIFAQSLGGGGGLVDDFFAMNAGGITAASTDPSTVTVANSGTVNVHLDGNLTASGEDNVGIYAQSLSAENQGNITVGLVDDKTIKVNDSGTGVRISGGAENTFTNEGGFVIAASEAKPNGIPGVMMLTPDGYTVVGEEGNETVINKSTGVFYGNMNLGGGVNRFTSELGASVFTGEEMFIGGDAQSIFTVAGLISPGDQSIYTTAITGNYVQTETSDFDLNLDFTDDSLDRLNITQNASLEGDLNVFTRGIENIKPGQRNLIFAATEGTITKEELVLNVPDSAIVEYFIGSTDKIAFLDIDVDFGGFSTLNRNQTSFGNYLNRVQLAGSDPSLAPLIQALFDLSNANQLADPYDSLSPEIYGTIQSNLELTSRQFVNDLFTCKTQDNNHRLMMEGECVWIGVSGRGYDGDRTYENFGFESASSGVSAGVQFPLGEDWFLAVAGGSSLYETRSSMPASIEGSSDQAGLALKKSLGATNLGLGIVGGSSEFDTERNALFPFSDRVTSTQDASFFGSWLRVSHDIDAGKQWYIRPMLDFGVTRVKYQGFEEEGAGPLSLVVSGDSKAYVSLTPAIEIGGEIRDNNLLIRPTVYLGYTQYLADPSPTVSARLKGAPSGVEAFDVNSLADYGVFNTSAAVELLFTNGFGMKLGYWGQYSAHTQSHGADFKMGLSF